MELNKKIPKSNYQVHPKQVLHEWTALTNTFIQCKISTCCVTDVMTEIDSLSNLKFQTEKFKANNQNTPITVKTK